MEKRYTFVWWGDGYFVYDRGHYIGKDDQVDLIRLMVDDGLAGIKAPDPNNDDLYEPDLAYNLPHSDENPDGIEDTT
jgi:hypothetical protein